VLLVSPLFPPDAGGVQRVAAKIAEHSRHEVTVLTEPADTADPPSRDEERSYEVVRRPLTGASGLVGHAAYVLRHAREFDVIYYTRSTYAYAALPASVPGTPIVAHAHGSELYPSQMSPVQRRLFRIGIRRIDEFVAVSDWTAHRLTELGVPRNRVTVVPNGVDFDRFADVPSGKAEAVRDRLGIDDDPHLLLTVGRVIERKGQHLVVEALERLDGVEYVVVGGGNCDRLRTLAEEIGVADRLHLVGYVPEAELPAYYAACDVFVMPSLFIEGDVESFGIVYLEANAAGKPVVAADTGGVSQAVRDGETGVLCEPTVDGVANAIRQIARDPDLRERLCENGVEWTREHRWEQVIEQIDDVIERTVASKD
jgi:phosphatidylinositol alpha-1,6-mannosyltransferase